MGSRIMSLLLSFALLAGTLNVPKAETGQNEAEQIRLTEEKNDVLAKKVSLEEESLPEQGMLSEKESLPEGESLSGQEMLREEESLSEQEALPEGESLSGQGMLQKEGNIPDQEEFLQEEAEQKQQVSQEQLWEDEDTDSRKQFGKTDSSMLFSEEMELPVFAAAKAAENEKYVSKKGYFYIFVRKQGESAEMGHWYKLSVSVPKLTAQKSQDITWGMTYVGRMPKEELDHVMDWIVVQGDKGSNEKDNYSLQIEKGKNWEKTRQDGLGINPVMGEPAPNLEELRPQGYPYKERYYMLCGKLYYTVRGYRMYFDNSVFQDMKGMDIEKENSQIQKKDSKLDKGEASWTGDGYFKFAIDTNNVGMTNYGASGEFHHSMYGFYLKPNQYTVAYNANGGTGTVKSQSAVYDENLSLRKNSFVREGYTFAGWNTLSNGKGMSCEEKQSVKNLTDVHKGTVTMYAQWRPNKLSVAYDANGGTSVGRPYDIRTYVNEWNYATPASAPEKFASFGLERTGYSKRAGAEWNTAANGTGTSYHENQTYGMLDYAADLKTGDRSRRLYAQWEPNIYTVTLDQRLTDLESKGTEAVYEKYENGWYLDKKCSSILKDRNKTGSIAVPRKSGYIFQGYYNALTGGTQMIDKTGKMTSAGIADYKQLGNTVWYARYHCLISCEDYADIPCDFEKAAGDTRENTGIFLALEQGQAVVETGQAAAEAGQRGVTVSLTGKPAGTAVGRFLSTAAGSSASGSFGDTNRVLLPLTPQEGAAYQLKVSGMGKVFCDRTVYFKDGRFRMLAKLGAKEKKEIAQGGTAAGSLWGTADSAYPLYRYAGCSEMKNIQSPGTVYRYYQYGDINMAYSGNGATSGRNILEYDVPLENMYQFRQNEFTREENKTKHTEDGKPYECKVKYGFTGWQLSTGRPWQEQGRELALQIYRQAQEEQAVLNRTWESSASYQVERPGKTGNHSPEYINFLAAWNAFPTIAVTPGSSLEFYEGEEVTKEDLINCLTAHDEEDNHKENRPYQPDLNDKLKIVKIVYPESQNGSQPAYEKIYKKDVPKDFLLDTYYLKLEKDETVDVLVTFSVTDSNGNTTNEEFPVRVKYNNYPEISSEDIFYYLKEEANRGEITEEALAGRAKAKDEEDGDLTDKLKLKEFDSQAIMMQTESRSEFEITYQVTDAYKKTSYKTVKLEVTDEDAVLAEMPKYYVRYISEKYLDTLEKNSVWREPENYAYLKQALENETAMETWRFAHTDVQAVQEWMGESGQGREQDFLTEFSYCRK